MGIIAIAITGCGGNSPKAPNYKSQNLAGPVFIQVSKDSSNNFIPVSLSSTNLKTGNFTLAVRSNGRPLLIGFRTNGEINCNQNWRSKKDYCKYDTPFFSNRVIVRIKPHGAIVLKESNMNNFLAKYNLYDKIKEFNEVNKIVRTKLKELEIDAKAQEKKYTKLKPKYSIKINDKSGLYDNSLNFDEAITYHYNYFPKPTYTISPYDLKDSSLNIKDFKSNTSSFYNIEKTKFLNATPSITSKLQEDIADKSSNVTINYGYVSDEKYQYSIDKLKKLSLNQDNKIVININSANITLDYPILSMHDKILSIEKKTQLTNNSRNFLSVKSISYYLNKDIMVDTDFDKNSILEIAPEAYVELSNKSAQKKFEEKLYFEKTTAKKLKSISKTYGVAIKYVTLNSTNIHTLYKRTTVSAYDIYKMNTSK